VKNTGTELRGMPVRAGLVKCDPAREAAFSEHSILK